MKLEGGRCRALHTRGFLRFKACPGLHPRSGRSKQSSNAQPDSFLVLLLQARIEHSFGLYDSWSFEDVLWGRPTFLGSLRCLISLRKLNFSLRHRYFSTLVQITKYAGMLQFIHIGRLGGITT